MWISNTVTADQCFEGGHTDADQDGLSDFCENNLVEAFAPELVLASALNDPATHEPRWVARPLGGNQVRLMYLLAYHQDGGSGNPNCSLVPGPIPYVDIPTQWYYPCGAHPGDSEVITLDVEYRPASEHWLLRWASFSAHTGYNVYQTSGTYPAKLQYAGSPGGRPRVHVAINKHANYATSLECNAPGLLGFVIDSCAMDRTMVVATGASRNLGSNHARFADCVNSSSPVYGPLGHSECFWTGTTFHGWTGAVGFPNPTMGYSFRLTTFGFMP